MLYQYLIQFKPFDSFMFSGETSLMPKKKKQNDIFSGNDSYFSRRQSFIVSTDIMPPQTTVMGAVRYIVLKSFSHDSAISEDSLIGSKSFNPAESDSDKESLKMGIINGISCVGITGKRCNSRVLCIPSPEDNLYSAADKDTYKPMGVEEYNPKEYARTGFFVYEMQYENTGLTCAKQPVAWLQTNKLIKKYEQSLIHIVGGRMKSHTRDYHMQERCKLMDSRFSKDKCGLEDPAFFVIVSLEKELDINKVVSQVSLGGRESIFAVSVEPCSIDVLSLKPFEPPTCEKKDYRLALISPARLPEKWQESPGLQQAFITTRPIRCAVTEKISDRYSLKLIGQRLTFADSGSVFIFDDESNRNAFREKLEGTFLTIGGFNLSISYEVAHERNEG